MKYHLFQVFGVELEYMIVRRDDMAIAPVADQIFYRKSGSFDGEAENGPISWSNELVSHVIELKTTSPVKDLDGFGHKFHENVRAINESLLQEDCFLLPSACHPFMDPFSETHIWPHDNHDIYNLYNRVFDCRGHGWSNVQSTHVNLPFYDDEEFARLHAAVRLILPVLPGLCASSPILDGRFSGYYDARMYHYQSNQQEIPQITGKVIPERVFHRADYIREIFGPINAALAPHDTERILDHHFVNSRGAIARFDRGAIEIRVMDVQECPRADFGLIGFLITVLKALVDEEFGDYNRQVKWHEDELSKILQVAIKEAEHGSIDNPAYLEFFRMKGDSKLTIHDFWEVLYEKLGDRLLPEEQVVVEYILDQGTLASRILQGVKGDYSKANIEGVYRSLGDCLAANQMYSGF